MLEWMSNNPWSTVGFGYLILWLACFPWRAWYDHYRGVENAKSDYLGF